MGHSLVALTVLCMCITVSVEAFMPGLATMRVGRSVRHSVNKKMGLRTARLTVSEERVAVEEDDIPASLAGFLKKSSAQDIQNRKTVIITGASSGIGLEAARQLANERGYYVIMACRSYSKAAIAANKMGMDPSTYKIMQLDLASLQSVRNFVASVRELGKKPDTLVCNAAVWYPQDKEPRLTVEGYEESVGTNHLAHFLLCQLMIPILPRGGRILFIGTETANDGLAGKVPPVADLGNLEGMRSGMSVTINGGPYEPTKAYKESKVCNAITMRELNKRYAETSGIVVNAMFPGCIAESPLFRQKRGWFRTIFPLFQKYITKQFVTETEAGRRIASCIADESLAVGGAYWKWNAKAGVDFERKISDENSTPAANVVRIPAEALDELMAEKVWDLSCILTGVQIAPDITIEDTEEAGKKLLTVQPTLVRDDFVRAEILLENLRALGDDISNPKVLTSEMTGRWAEEMYGEKYQARALLYYQGRRDQTPIVSFIGDSQDDPDFAMEIKAQKPVWSEESAALFRNMLLERLPNVPTEAQDDQGSDMYGTGTSNSDLIPQSLLVDIAKQMDELNKPPPPPEGLDAAIFGERGSLQREFAVSLGNGMIKP